jgi:hypothetical protein
MRSATYSLVLFTVLAACASTPPLRVHPGDRCRVYCVSRNSPTLELVNQPLFEADPDVQERVKVGPTKVMSDNDMAHLVAELESLQFFAQSRSGPLETAGSALVVEHQGQRHLLGPGPIDSGTQKAFTACFRAFQDTFNLTPSFQARPVSTSGAEFFEAEQRRLQQHDHAVQKLRERR